MTSTFEGTQPLQNKALSLQSKQPGPHLGFTPCSWSSLFRWTEEPQETKHLVSPMLLSCCVMKISSPTFIICMSNAGVSSWLIDLGCHRCGKECFEVFPYKSGFLKIHCFLENTICNFAPWFFFCEKKTSTTFPEDPCMVYLPTFCWF